jgi:hypothetical protein
MIDLRAQLDHGLAQVDELSRSVAQDVNPEQSTIGSIEDELDETLR